MSLLRNLSTTLICATLALGCVAAPPDELEPGDDDALCGGKCDDGAASELRAEARRLRADFAEVRGTAYRMRMFELIRQLRRQSVAATEAGLGALLIEARAGADGLEPLILAYVDALARRGDKKLRGRVTSALKAAKGRIVYRWKRPFPGTLVPLGRFDTAVIIDVRADAARRVFDGLLRHPDRLSFEELLGLGDVREDLCGMQGLSSLQTTLDPMALESDEEREDLCKGGKMKGGAAGTLGAIGASGCLDMDLDAFRHDDEYTTEEMTDDLEQCMEDLMPKGGGNPLASGGAGGMLGLLGIKIEADLGPAAAEAVKGVFDVVKGVGGFGGDVAKMALQEYFKVKAEERANARADEQARIDAEVNAVQAIVAYDEAQQATADAEAALDDAQDALADADRELDGVAEQHRQGQASDQQLAIAQQRRNEAKTEVDKAKQEVKDAKAAEAKAKEQAAKAVAEAAKKAEESQDALEPAGVESAACSRLTTFGKDINDPVDMGKLPEGWMETMGRVDPRTVNPNPEADDPRASDAFGLPECGQDPATMNGSAVDCNSLVHCTDATQQCGCNGGAAIDEAGLQKFMRGLAASACATTTCADGSIPQPAGLMCVCQQQEMDGGTPPRPRPLPVGDGVIEGIYMAPAAQTPIDGREDPMSLIAREAFRH